MGRSLFTVGQRIWHRVQRPFGAVGGHNSHGHRSAAALSGCTDSEPFRQNRRGADRPLLLIQSMPRAMDQSLWPLPPKALVRPAEPDAFWRERYLFHQENCPRDIQRLEAILRMPRVLLEIGCGDAEAARQIALKNPGTGIIATDLYAQAPCQSNGSGYGKTAWSWRQRLLPAQQDAPANLVILRAEADLLGFLPDRSVDTVFFAQPRTPGGQSLPRPAPGGVVDPPDQTGADPDRHSSLFPGDGTGRLRWLRFRARSGLVPGAWIHHGKRPGFPAGKAGAVGGRPVHHLGLYAKLHPAGGLRLGGCPVIVLRFENTETYCRAYTQFLTTCWLRAPETRRWCFLPHRAGQFAAPAIEDLVAIRNSRQD